MRKCLNTEMQVIMNKTKVLFDDRTRSISSFITEKFDPRDLLFYPRLTLIANPNTSQIDEIVRTLSSINLVIFISTELHNQVPEQVVEENLYYDELQIPILVGDLLYSKIFNILCQQNLIEYIKLYVNYIEPLNLTWVNYLEDKVTLEELCCQKFGELGRVAAFTGLQVDQEPDPYTSLIGECCFALGNIFGAQRMGLSEDFVKQQVTNLNYHLSKLDSWSHKSLFLFQANQINKNSRRIKTTTTSLNTIVGY